MAWEGFFIPLVVVFFSLRPVLPARTASAHAVCRSLGRCPVRHGSLRAGESLFVIYLEDFATLNAVYGAFGGCWRLLLWIYLSGCVFIFGACLCAGQAEALGQPATR